MPRERRRHQLYEEAKKVFSPDSADELMAYPHPVGSTDVATRPDQGLLIATMIAFAGMLAAAVLARGQLHG
jgi:hypothetical protein